MKRVLAVLVVLVLATSAWACSRSQDDTPESSMASSSEEASSEANPDVEPEISSPASLPASEESVPLRNGLDEEANHALEAAKLIQKKDTLEYSKKAVDPLKFVECDNPAVEVSVSGKLDLSKVGAQEVAYVLALDGESVQRSVTFNVRDTKAPKINFKNKAPSVELNGSYDPASNVKWVKDPVDGELAKVDKAPKAQGEKAGNEVVYERGWYTVEGDIDTSTPGSYDITVTAADINGNVATRTFAVTVKQPEVSSVAETAPASSNVHTYILNTSSGKFHNPYCRDIGKMSESNKREVEMTRQEVIDSGYSPCGHCNP